MRLGLKSEVTAVAPAGRNQMAQERPASTSTMTPAATDQNRAPRSRVDAMILAGIDGRSAATTPLVRRLVVPVTLALLRRARTERELRVPSGPRSTSARASAKSRMVGNRSAGVFSRD